MAATGSNTAHGGEGDNRTTNSANRPKLNFWQKYKNLIRKHTASRKRRHFARSDDDAFNALLELWGENYYGVIHKDNAEGTTWETETAHPIQPRELLKLYRDGSVVVGLRDNYLTQLLKIDIDRDSSYHPYNDERAFRCLLGTLEDMGLVGVEVVQSSFSEGLHLYIALPESVVSWYAANALHVGLTKAGFVVAQGQLELFPNRKGWNDKNIVNFNGLRMPLQPGTGSYVLDHIDFCVEHNDLKAFVGELKHHARRQDIKTFKRLIASAYKEYKQQQRKAKKQHKGEGAEAFLKSLQDTVYGGWTGRGQTNTFLPEAVKLALVFWHWQGEELVEKLAKFLPTLPGYEEYCGHKHDLEQRIRHWYKWAVNQGYYPYTGEYRVREACESYGDGVAATYAAIAQREDGRSYNKANQQRQQAARDKLAATMRLLRGEIRQGTCIIPQTLTALLKLVNDTAKQHFDKGFSYQFLHKRCKSLWEKLQSLAARAASRENKQAPLADIPTVEVEEAVKPLESLPEEGLPAFEAVEDAKVEVAQSQAQSGVTGFSGIYEGGGEPPQAVLPVTDVVTDLAKLWRDAGTVLRYTGKVITGYVERIIPHPTKGKFSVTSIFPNTLVQLTNFTHSSESTYGMVYVKPLGKSWLDGIAVPIQFLTIPEPPS